MSVLKSARETRLLCFLMLPVVLMLASCVGSTKKVAGTDTGEAGGKSQAGVREIKDYEIQLFDDSGALTKVKLSQAVGQGKVVVIDFWATWCGPCRQSIPDLVAMQQEYKDKGVQVFGLSTEDPEDSKELVAGAAKSLKMTYKIGFVSREMFMSFTRSGTIPQCFVFGKDGKLVKQLTGFNPNISPRILREAVDKALQS